ncbi:hypothetical protein N9L68_01485 [bacterium]|nr:hypothetical protein [bacterium]
MAAPSDFQNVPSGRGEHQRVLQEGAKAPSSLRPSVARNVAQCLCVFTIDDVASRPPTMCI